MHISSVKIVEHQLDFKFEAGTSRGSLKHKDTWYIMLYNEDKLLGIGEAGPLKGLSIESIDSVPEELSKIARKLEGMILPVDMDGALYMANEICDINFPSIKFGVETALLDALNGGDKVIIPGNFRSKEKRIPINGLVWMGDKDFMQQQISDKLEAGFNCIKMKIGAIDFETEIALLENIRNEYPPDKITLRVDANGAFKNEDAKLKLKRLADLSLHSIEQPITAGQSKEMADLCKNTPLAIALDEELIGINGEEAKRAVLTEIMPQYIIIKPSLVGGIASSLEWVKIAESLNIDWWLTSMLESNIGLNAICQLADFLNVTMPQGLGTGQLYHNNISSPLVIEEGHVFYSQQMEWGEIPTSSS